MPFSWTLLFIHLRYLQLQQRSEGRNRYARTWPEPAWLWSVGTFEKLKAARPGKRHLTGTAATLGGINTIFVTKVDRKFREINLPINSDRMIFLQPIPHKICREKVEYLHVADKLADCNLPYAADTYERLARKSYYSNLIIFTLIDFFLN